MNNRIIRYFNQNRIKVIITIFVIVFIIILIYTVNSILANREPENTQRNDTIIDSSVPSESVITGETVDTDKTEANTNLIEEFVNYCNNGDYENAYNLLSQDCKDEVFSDIDNFINNYITPIFNTRKIYSLELWYNTSSEYTYRTIYQEDNILSTGVVNSGNNIEDYITVIEDGDNYKLNINGFINKETINKTQDTEGIQITINNRKRYRSYERYSITVTNNTENTIRINDGQNGNDICLVDRNEVEYNSMINEVPISSLELEPGGIRSFDIRFYKIYNLYRTIEGIRFKNIDTNIDADDNELINIQIDI